MSHSGAKTRPGSPATPTEPGPGMTVARHPPEAPPPAITGRSEDMAPVSAWIMEYLARAAKEGRLVQASLRTCGQPALVR